MPPQSQAPATGALARPASTAKPQTGRAKRSAREVEPAAAGGVDQVIALGHRAEERGHRDARVRLEVEVGGAGLRQVAPARPAGAAGRARRGRDSPATRRGEAGGRPLLRPARPRGWARLRRRPAASKAPPGSRPLSIRVSRSLPIRPRRSRRPASRVPARGPPAAGGGRRGAAPRPGARGGSRRGPGPAARPGRRRRGGRPAGAPGPWDGTPRLPGREVDRWPWAPAGRGRRLPGRGSRAGRGCGRAGRGCWRSRPRSIRPPGRRAATAPRAARRRARGRGSPGA